MPKFVQQHNEVKEQVSQEVQACSVVNNDGPQRDRQEDEEIRVAESVTRRE